jgi:hypothetical protein
MLHSQREHANVLTDLSVVGTSLGGGKASDRWFIKLADKKVMGTGLFARPP